MRDTGAGTSARSGRLHALDTAKGIGIILVVFGHAWRGAFDAGVLADSGLFRLIDTMIYAFHMPLFFLLSGVFFLEMVQKVPPLPFLTSRARRLLWPMALWSWIFFGVKLIAGDAANHPVSLVDFPLIPLPPFEHLWFLWALMLVQVAALGLWLAMRRAIDTGRMRVVFAVTAVMLALLIPYVAFPSPLFGAALQHFPFFIAGIALGGVAHVRPPMWLVAVSALLFGGLLFAVAGQGAPLILSLALILLASVVIARLDPNTDQAAPALNLLRSLGAYSLAIFLAHTIFSAGLRIVLLMLGIEVLVVHLILATLVGLIGPVLLVLLARKMRLAGVLGF